MRMQRALRCYKAIRWSSTWLRPARMWRVRAAGGRGRLARGPVWPGRPRPLADPRGSLREPAARGPRGDGVEGRAAARRRHPRAGGRRFAERAVSRLRRTGARAPIRQIDLPSGTSLLPPSVKPPQAQRLRRPQGPARRRAGAPPRAARGRGARQLQGRRPRALRARPRDAWRPRTAGPDHLLDHRFRRDRTAGAEPGYDAALQALSGVMAATGGAGWAAGQAGGRVDRRADRPARFGGDPGRAARARRDGPWAATSTSRCSTSRWPAWSTRRRPRC
jgi:hypothetical protein